MEVSTTETVGGVAMLQSFEEEFGSRVRRKRVLMGYWSREMFCRKYNINEHLLRDVEKAFFGNYQTGELLLIIKALKFEPR